MDAFVEIKETIQPRDEFNRIYRKKHAIYLELTQALSTSWPQMVELEADIDRLLRSTLNGRG